MKVLCYGFGFVGKAYALFLRELGHEIDIKTGEDKTSNEALNHGFSVIDNDLFDVYSYHYKPDALIVSVPTPTIKGKQDLRILEMVFKEIRNVKSKYIFLKSTTTPKNLDRIAKLLHRNQTLVMYPEFLEAKNPIGGVFNQRCKVFGKKGKWTIKEKRLVEKLFGFSIKETTFTDIKTAGMLKYIHNIWLACNVSFWNSMTRLVKDFNPDVVLEETHKSEYFGTHPWHIGTAYGGACLPKDIKAFLGSLSKNKSKYKKFIKMIDTVNEEVLKNG